MELRLTAEKYQNATIRELRLYGWNYVRLVPQDQTHKGAGVLVRAQSLVTDWDQMTERVERAEAENAQLRETIAARSSAASPHADIFGNYQPPTTAHRHAKGMTSV
jgi:hypothetical protein